MKELDATQVEQLRTIGAYLGRERQERGVSLDEIAVKTYIPQRLLQALENGQVERLPEPVFVQGFIRRFADAIGLDGVALAKTFTPQASFMVERNEPVTEQPPLERQASREQPPITPPTVEPTTIKHTAVEPISVPSEYIQRDDSSAKRSPLPWVLLGTAAALLLGVGLVNLLNRPKPAIETQNTETPGISTSSAAPSPQPSIATAPNASPASQNAAPTTTQSGTTSALNSPVQVAVNLTGDSWFQVIADGKTEFEGTLKKGEQKTWTAQKKLVLQAGNAGAVSLSYNQSEAKRMGELGEVKDATFLPSDKPKASN